MASAQGWGRGWNNAPPPGRNNPERNLPERNFPERNFPERNAEPQRRLPAPETVTVSGELTVAYGWPALKSDDTTYIVSGLNRLIGFVDGFKEGAQVTIEGSAIAVFRDEKVKFLRPSKLIFNGNTYDMASPFSLPDLNRTPPVPRYQNPPAPRGNQAPPPPPAPGNRGNRNRFL